MDAFRAFVETDIVPACGPNGPLVEVFPGPFGNSLRLIRDVKVGEILFKIPASSLLRVPGLNTQSDTASKSPASLDFFARAQNGDSAAFSDDLPFDDLRLILELIHQRSLGPKSPWFGYISLLPVEFPTCPLFWSEEDTERRLAGSPLYGLTEELRGQLKEAWIWTMGLLEEYLPAEERVDFTWEAFVWAYTAVQSRAFKVHFPGKPEDELETVMVPFGDMANHAIVAEDAVVRNLHRVDPTSGCLEAISARNAKCGEEFTIHYNDLAPWQTLLHYGFSVPLSAPNPFDRINLALAFPDEDSYELESKKLLFFNMSDELAEEHSLSAEPTSEFLASLRVALATEDELENVEVANIGDLALKPRGLGDENELRAIETLGGMVRSLDSLYPRSLEEDTAALEELEGKELDSSELSDREALRYVVGQRRLLACLASWADSRLEETSTGRTR